MNIFSTDISSRWDFLLFDNYIFQNNSKNKTMTLFSPDGSGNPFAFSFKKQKIGADSRNVCLQKMRNHSLKANIIFYILISLGKFALYF
ncbi:hypothetical protein C4F50_24055 [Flavobacterium sp. KB82]|uniref:Uncharacterized protein n=1 Tax=Flavobacterium hungaricum TaxID=2082725 RepID=A0ABR9TTN5_9FLAO|nr:hypothetical protein [Flavobacterium hungaricum]